MIVSAVDFFRTNSGFGVPETGLASRREGAPSPSISGIIEFGENRKLNLGVQSLAGKILMSKSLQAQAWGQIPTMGTNATLRTVSASTMITDWESAAQG